MRLSEIVKNLSSEARELNSESIAACDVAAASYTASYVLTYILLELDRLRVGFKIPTFVSKGGEIYRDFSSRIKQASWSHPSHEASKKPVAIAEKPAAAVLPETSPSHESIWVAVLLPARLHTGPSVDTPISNFYAVGTPLRATRFRHDWFEITESNTSQSGWIYRKYLGEISHSEQSKITSQEAQRQSHVVKVPVPTASINGK